MNLQILPSAKSPGIGDGLSYSSDKDIHPGTLVRVPLRNQTTEGIVFGSASDDQKFDLKSIKESLSDTPLLCGYHLQLLQWISDHYACNKRRVLTAFLPGQPWASLLPTPVQGFRLLKDVPCRGVKQQAIVDVLSTKDWVAWEELREATGVTTSTVKALVSQGIIEEIFQDQFSGNKDSTIQLEAPALSSDQEEVFHTISHSEKPSLLFGVTGSGKTEVYMSLISKILEQGKQALVLVPEILLTEHSLPRYANCIDSQYIAVVHSRLTPAQKRETWKKIRYGDIKLVIGSRSALFSPLQDLGLVILDEEHEWTFKNEQSPRYHAREAAEKLCEFSGAQLVLGSATPSLESWHKAKSGAYTLVRLDKRYGDAEMPLVKVVDLGNVAFGNHYPFSNTLLDAIEKRLQKNEQTVLFLNRRGTATSLLCMDCRRRIMSPESNLPFTVHRGAGNTFFLQDHTTGATAEIPDECPGCQSTRLQAVGAGTEKVEQILKQRFPSARILRADSDTLTHPDEIQSILHEMSEGHADILLGTQSVVKGLDLPSVTLAAVLIADVGMSLPHFRAGERTFQLLTQLTGRSGRKIPGEVIVQTFRPDSPEVKYSALHNTEEYLERELSLREKSGYPPFSSMVRVTFRGDSQKNRAEVLLSHLQSAHPSIQAYTAPTFFGGGREWHVLLRTHDLQGIVHTLKQQEDCIIDVDPLQCL